MADTAETLVGTRIKIGYEDGTSETFDTTLTLREAQNKYHTVLVGDDEMCACNAFVCIETVNVVHYRRLSDIDQFSMTRHTLVDASNTRKRRSPRKPAEKRTATAPVQEQTKKA